MSRCIERTGAGTGIGSGNDAAEPPRYMVSVAPTSSVRCLACDVLIERGVLTVSLLLPRSSRHTGAVAHQYHFAHGMRAAAMTPCGRRSLPPAFSYASVLNRPEELRARLGARRVLEIWHAREEACRADCRVQRSVSQPSTLTRVSQLESGIP